MSNADSHKKGEYVCVDHQARRSTLGGTNRNQLRYEPSLSVSRLHNLRIDML